MDFHKVNEKGHWVFTLLAQQYSKLLVPYRTFVVDDDAYWPPIPDLDKKDFDVDFHSIPTKQVTIAVKWFVRYRCARASMSADDVDSGGMCMCVGWKVVEVQRTHGPSYCLMTTTDGGAVKWPRISGFCDWLVSTPFSSGMLCPSLCAACPKSTWGMRWAVWADLKFSTTEYSNPRYLLCTQSATDDLEPWRFHEADESQQHFLFLVGWIPTLRRRQAKSFPIPSSR